MEFKKAFEEAREKNSKAMAKPSEDKKEEEIAQAEKDKRTELSKKLDELRKERTARLEELGRGNKLVGQLIDLALLAGGMLKGESLNKFIRRSVEMIEK